MYQRRGSTASFPEDANQKDELCEDVTDVIGQFRQWQWIIFGFVFYVYGVTSLPALNVTFLAPNVTFLCSEDRDKDDLDFRNFTGDQCLVFNSSKKCEHWVYDTSFWQNTLTQKFDLVCGNSFYISLSNTVHHFGDIIASLFLSYLSDRFGRRPVFLFATVPGLVASVLALFAPNIYTFLVAKFFYGLSALSLVSVGFVLLMEVVGPKYRGSLGLLVELSWAFFYVTLPGVAILMKDSFNVQLYTTCAYSLLLLLWFIVPESPRWLILHNRLEQAEKVMTRAAKINKVHVPDMKTSVAKLASFIQKQSEAGEKSTTYTILDLFKTPVIRRRFIILAIYWFVNGFVYYGISLNSEIFGGNVFLNFFLFGVVEIPAYIIVSWVIQRLGRKLPLLGTMIVAGLSCIGFLVVPDEIMWLRVVLTVVGKFFIASSFALAYPYTTEVFPTAVRTIALGSCSMVARVATMIAPFVKEMETVTSLGTVMAIFGGLGLVSGGLCWWMPETKDKALPETIAEGEAFGIRKDTVSEVALVDSMKGLEGVDNPVGPAEKQEN